jgi:hypothetical protein
VDDDVAGVGPLGVGVAAGAVAPLVDVGVLLGDGLADRVGVADRERLAVRDGAGDHDRVGVDAGVMTGPVGVCVRLTGVSVVLSFAGRTSTYRASTPMNSPSSTIVEVRGLLMTRSLSPGRCQARRPR